MRQQISIIHPSRSRSVLAATTAGKWISRAKNKERLEYILSIDDNDPCSQVYISNVTYGSFVSNPNKNAIEAINNAAKICKGDILIAISDDFNEPPQDWDEQLCNALAGRSNYVVKTQDGQQAWIITLPIMDRMYYERFGYIYYPGYQHMFCDTEMTHVADILGCKITLPIVFKHNHYSTGHNKKDAVSEKADRTWAQGEALYLKRLGNNFDLTEKGKLNCDINHTNWLRKKGIHV